MTSLSCRHSILKVMRKVVHILRVALAAIVLVYMADCFMPVLPGAMDEHSAECCAAMRCTTTSMSQDCCKIAPSGTPASLAVSASPAPKLKVLAVLPTPPVAALLVGESWSSFPARSHAPPKPSPGSLEVLRI